MLESARYTAQKILRGETSATELVKGCLARIRQYNPTINAIVTLDENRALSAATLADASQGSGTLLPLHGIPISVKDAFETAGLKTTSSYLPLANHIPTRDASVVARLKAAGAIVLGKTAFHAQATFPICPMSRVVFVVSFLSAFWRGAWTICN